MELINHCMARGATPTNSSEKLDGAGEELIVTLDSEDTEIKAYLPHDGQGDFAESIVDAAEKDAESTINRRHNELAVIGVRMAAIATLHPLEYAKVLIQLGHEPMPAQMGKTFLGHTVKTWPNLFKYIGHIYGLDGFYGCYRGLTPRLLGFMVSLMGGKEIVDRLGLAVSKEDDVNHGSFKLFVVTLKRDVVLTATGLLLSHPFHVISLRMMAQFVGHETTYQTILGSFLVIYRNEGLAGFFAGLVPKLICDISCVLLTSSVTYLVNKYFVKDKLIRQYNGGLVHYIFASMLYPLQVISTCMAVSNSGLSVARPPSMMTYNNWMDCWYDLSSRGEHKRGASLFWRSVPIPLKQLQKAHPPILEIVTKDAQA